MSNMNDEMSIGGRLAALGCDIKVSHSVFALPFALLGAFLAAGGYPGLGRLVLIVVCMVFARTYAMLANRYVDRRIDGVNPRTAGRALPRGVLSGGFVFVSMIVSVAGFMAGVLLFGVVYGNWWPMVLSPVVVVWLGCYGYFKRFTIGSHFVLGGALALAPIGAAVAVEPGYAAEPALWFLAGFVWLWVAGFDVIYALQDIEVDREHGLYSIPAKFGRMWALVIAKLAHLVALLMLVLVQNGVEAFRENRVIASADMSYFLVGVVIVAVLLIAEHRAASQGRFKMAFFTVNGVISCVVGGLGIVDIMLL